MELHEYQKRIASHIARQKRCIISVDMGLGKTAAVLAFLEWRRPKTCLIVAPKRVAENNWHTEAQKWGYTYCFERMAVVKGAAKKRREVIADEAHPYKIISRDNIKDVTNRFFDVMIIDELTSFKSVAASRTKAVCSIGATYKVGLTGTFLANGAIDIYGQAAAVGLADKLAPNFYAWRATYFVNILKGSGLSFERWILNGSIDEVLKPIQEQIFTLTAGDYLQIPPVTHTHHDVVLDGETRTAYDNLEAFLGLELGGEVLSVKEGAKFAKLQTLCNGFIYQRDEVTGDELPAVRGARSAKLEAVADFIADCKDAGEPVLLFYAFREEAIWLKELLDERGVRCESVKADGFMQRWNDGKIECLFAHPASAGHGLNLQHGGRTIVWSSLTYNYELYAQANARLARQGQRRNVQIHYFSAIDTCEHRVWRALMAKDREQKEFLKLTKQ